MGRRGERRARSESAAFRGRTAIVTGGASGIGRALGERLAELGAKVVLADVDGDAVERTAAELGDGVVGRRLDVTDGPAFAALVDEVVDRDGTLDLLFNNAGVSLGGPTHEMTAAHWDRVLDVNLGGVVNGVLAAYPRMIEQGHGHIVNTASAAGLSPPPFLTAYTTTKFGVVGLSRGLRPEAALHGVKVSVFCPGPVDTPLLDVSGPPGLPPTSAQEISGRDFLAIVGQKPVAPAGVARRALELVAANRAVIVVPASAKTLWYVDRWCPPLGSAVLGYMTRRVDRRI